MPRFVQPGHHVKVSRGVIDHHGIYMGTRNGIHVVAELAKPGEGGIVRLVSWKMFSRGSEVQIVDHANGLPLNMVVENVLRTPRWRKYNLLDWNCEHFATWCSTHESRSAQVENFAKAGAAVAVLLFLFSLAE